jgi:putative endonuclease
VKENKKLQIVNKIGKLGEEIACKYLMDKGFSILRRNYRENWGEIDIVAKKDHRLSFFEVKSVSCVTERFNSDTQRNDVFRPEDNVSKGKMLKMSRIIGSYLINESVSDETEWDFNVLSVFVDSDKNKAFVRLVENVLL